MAEELYISIKTDIKAATKDIEDLKKETKSAVDGMGAFGVTWGGVKEQFNKFKAIAVNGLKLVKAQAILAGNGVKLMFAGKATKGAKVFFNVVKAGIASTGIGLLLVAFSSLMAWFKKTKAGAEALSKIFAGVGAAVSVFVDRFISYGKLLASIITLDFKGMAANAKATFAGIGDELSREIKLAMKLADATHALADSERALSVETAKKRADIEDLKKIAEDLSLTEEERLAAAESAFEMENNLLAKRIANAEEAVRIQEQQNIMSDNMAADLDALAQKEIDLANIRQESATKQIELNNKINSIKAQTEAKEIAAQQKWVQRQNEKIQKQNQTIIAFNKMRREELLKTLKNERNREKTQALWKMQEREKLINDTVFDEEKKDKLISENFNFYEIEKKRIKKKYDDISKENEEKMAADLLAIQNETLLLEIENVRDRADEEMKIAEKAELKAVERRADTEELQEAIRDKYAALRKEKKDQEAEEDKERDKQVAAAKVQILADTLAVGQQYLDLQAAELESNYDKEIKLAKASGKSTEAIEEKYEGKRREQAKKFKAMKIAMAIVDTYQSAVAAYAAGLSVGGPAGLVIGPISAALAVAAGLANIAMIEKQPLGGGGGGKGGGGGGGAAPAAAATPPSGNMMSGAFELGGGVAPEPVKAYVVTDEMSNSQNQLANIRRRSTI